MKQIGMAIYMYAGDYDEAVVPSQNGTSGVNLVSWPTMLMPYLKSADVFVCPSANTQIMPPGTMSKYIPGSTRRWINIATGNQAKDDGGDGSDWTMCKVPRLSYARNLIPSTNGTPGPWDAINSGRVTNNGKSYPNWNINHDKSGWVGKGTTYTIRLSQVENPATTIHIMDGMAGATASGDPTTYGGSMRGIQYDVRTDMFPDDAPSKVAPRHNGGFIVLYGDGHSGFRKWGQSTPCDWVIQQASCN